MSKNDKCVNCDGVGCVLCGFSGRPYDWNTVSNRILEERKELWEKLKDAEQTEQIDRERTDK